MGSIVFKSGYKYKLVEPYCGQIDLYPLTYIDTGWIKLSTSGDLIVSEGFAWDGPSGPTIDTKSAMRGSLIHDCLYCLLRSGHLNETNRKRADEIYRETCIEDGMSRFRAWAHFDALRIFGGSSASPSGERPILIAP